MRKTGSFVIAGNDVDWNAAIRDAAKRVVGLVGDTRHDLRTIEHVAGVNDGVDLAIHRRCERRGVVREKIVASAAATGARANRQVESEV